MGEAYTTVLELTMQVGAERFHPLTHLVTCTITPNHFKGSKFAGWNAVMLMKAFAGGKTERRVWLIEASSPEAGLEPVEKWMFENIAAILGCTVHETQATDFVWKAVK